MWRHRFIVGTNRFGMTSQWSPRGNLEWVVREFGGGELQPLFLSTFNVI